MINGSDSAYPKPSGHSSFGLTKREYFAGLAMQAMIASESYKNMSESNIEEWATRYADALIRSLNTNNVK